MIITYDCDLERCVTICYMDSDDDINPIYQWPISIWEWSQHWPWYGCMDVTFGMSMVLMYGSDIDMAVTWQVTLFYDSDLILKLYEKNGWLIYYLIIMDEKRYESEEMTMMYMRVIWICDNDLSKLDQ